MTTNDQNSRFDPDTFDIRASVRSILDAARHHRLVVLLTCLASLAAVALYITLWPPLYTAEATIMAEPDYDYQRDTFYTGWRIFRKDEARTEIEMVTSGQILAEVVRQHGLTYDDVHHPFLAHAAYLWEKSWIGKNYRQVKRIVFGTSDDPDAPRPEDIEFGRTVAGLASGVKLEPVGESNVGRLTVKGPSRRVALIANTLIDVYLARRIERHRAEARASFDALKEQVEVASKELRSLSGERLSFSQKHELTFDFQKEGLEVAKLAELEATVATTKATIASEEASLREVEAQLALEPPTRTVSTVSEVNVLRETTKAKRLELQVALLNNRARFREDAPEVQEIKQALGGLDALAGELAETVPKATTEGLNVVRQELVARRNALSTDVAGARASLAVLEGTAARLKARLITMPALRNALEDMDRDLATASEKYKQLVVKQQQAALSLSTSGDTIQSVRVVDYAATPANRTWPKPKILYPFALLLGLSLGVGLAVLISQVSGRVLREHVEHGRGAVPLYGTVAMGGGRTPLLVASRDARVAASPSGPSEAART